MHEVHQEAHASDHCLKVVVVIAAIAAAVPVPQLPFCGGPCHVAMGNAISAAVAGVGTSESQLPRYLTVTHIASLLDCKFLQLALTLTETRSLQ